MNVEESRKAIKAASDFYKSIIPEAKAEDIRLEGIETVEKNKHQEIDYKITLSYPEEGYIFADKSKRHYNVFMIHGKNFELISMSALEPNRE